MKRFLALVLALLLMTLFVGCGDSGATADEAPKEDSVVQADYNLVINAFNYNGAEHKFSVEDVNNGSREVLINNISFVAHTGDTVAEVLQRSGYANFKMEEVLDKFLGFMEYKIVVSNDENGYDIVTYEKVSNDLYTVEELMSKAIDDYSVTYVAKWESIPEDYYTACGY